MPKTEEDFLPDAVKKQGQQADEAQAAAKKKKAPTKKKKAAPNDQPPASDPASEPAIPDNSQPASEPNATPDAQQSDAFEQKYKVLQGKYDREILEQGNQIKELSTVVQNQAAIIEKLNGVLENGLPAADPGRAADPQPAQSTPSTDASIFSGYGSEMVDFVNTVNALISRMDALEASFTQGFNPSGDISARLENIEQLQARSAKDSFYDALDTHVPSWGQTNVDSGFKAWLQEVDPMSGIQRSAMLKRALDTFNADQAIAIFKAFQPAQPAPNAEPASELDGMVVPDQTGNADPSQHLAPPVKYSTKEEFLDAQQKFVKKQITENDFNKIANSYQMGLAAAKARS